MTRLEDLIRGIQVKGLLPNSTVTLVDVEQYGDTASVTYKDDSGGTGNSLLFRSNESSLEIVHQRSRWRFEADGALFRLVSEAYRIRLAHLFDPFLAIHTSRVEPYPHQITAVYAEMLPRQPLRFLLADDPGAGKTIMAGLLIKELMIRGDLQRCLIVVPGNLVEQWQQELKEKFELDFEILTNEHIKTANNSNVLAKMPLLIARVDKLKRYKTPKDKKLQEDLKQIDWDLIICDEAHKMSASFSGGEVSSSQRYKLGQLLSDHTRHFLLMTATPHNGKEADFQLFMALLDRDRFEGKFRNGVHPTDTSDMMRRMVKEDLVNLDGTRLLPERKAYTVTYYLSDLESRLYEQVTGYVREEFDRAEELESGSRRSIGFALTILQRRLASSPKAIYQSLQRRRKKLEEKLREREIQIEEPLDVAPDEDIDDLPDAERQQLEDKFVDRATTARTIKELEMEINRVRQLEQLAQRVVSGATDRKLEELSQLFENDLEMFDRQGSRRKLIIFTEHRDTLDYLVERMSRLIGHEAVVTIHGSMQLEERRQTQKVFNQDPNALVLVATDAAGEGINLQQSCHLMVNYDLPWNPNRLEQRFGRIHRIGQTEVCHLWNLVAGDTREGLVYETLLKKLEAARDALGGKVFDVLGEAINGEELRELLIDAIRYGNRPDVRERLSQAEARLDIERLRQLLEERSLNSEFMNVSSIRQIREDIERAETRKLQPYFVAEFFLKAFQQLGGKVREKELGRHEVTFTPIELRNRLSKSYSNICFKKELIHLPNKPQAEFICPGHPLLDATLDLFLERHRALLKAGSILVNESDPGERVHILVYLEHAIQDARTNQVGERRDVSRQMQYVEIDSQGEIHNAGYAPYLDYRPLAESEQPLVAQILVEQSSLLQKGIEEQAQGYAIRNLVPQHYQEVQQRRAERITKTMNAVEERLTTEINHWEAQAEKWQQQERAGKQNARLSYENARRRSEEIKARRHHRLEELEKERQLLPQPPLVVGGALVIPIGLIQRLQGGNQVTSDILAVEKERVEKLAMEAVMSAERALGFEPRDVSANRCGYDIESCIPHTGQLRFIEVKGRVSGADIVTVTKNEILTALNKVDSFILALVEVPESKNWSEKNCGIRYLLQPFTLEPDFAMTSTNYNWQKLWTRGEQPHK